MPRRPDRAGQRRPSAFPWSVLHGAGESQVVAPDGTVVAIAPRTGEAIVVADIDVALADDKTRPDGTDVMRSRRPELYAPLGAEPTGPGRTRPALPSCAVAVIQPAADGEAAIDDAAAAGRARPSPQAPARRAARALLLRRRRGAGLDVGRRRRAPCARRGGDPRRCRPRHGRARGHLAARRAGRGPQPRRGAGRRRRRARPPAAAAPRRAARALGAAPSATRSRCTRRRSAGWRSSSATTRSTRRPSGSRRSPTPTSSPCRSRPSRPGRPARAWSSARGRTGSIVVAASRPGPAGPSLVCDLPHDFTLWSPHWSAPFAGVISHPDVVRADAEPGALHLTVHPARGGQPAGLARHRSRRRPPVGAAGGYRSRTIVSGYSITVDAGRPGPYGFRNAVPLGETLGAGHEWT